MNGDTATAERTLRETSDEVIQTVEKKDIFQEVDDLRRQLAVQAATQTGALATQAAAQAGALATEAAAQAGATATLAATQAGAAATLAATQAGQAAATSAAIMGIWSTFAGSFAALLSGIFLGAYFIKR